MKYEEIIECQFSTMKDKELHFHQEPEIIYLLDGELTVSGENMSHLLKKDDFATMIMSALMGSLIVTVADICARSLYSTELPVSIMTTVVGVPMLVYFLYKRGKENL